MDKRNSGSPNLVEVVVLILLVLLILCMFFALRGKADGQTLLHRIDMRPHQLPYHTSAWLDKSGWEIWAFGETDPSLLDLELGKMTPVGKQWLLGGYGVFWPQAGKIFAMPWLTYSTPMGGGLFTANLASYLPVNGGPIILFMDDTSLVWSNKASQGIGLVASLFHVQGDPWAVPIGLTARLPLDKRTNLKLNYQPFQLVGHTQAQVRLELSHRF